MHTSVNRRQFLSGTAAGTLGLTLGSLQPARSAHAFEADDRPCVIGSRRFGRISIANSDAAATPHTDAAIDEGYRAVGEQLVVRSRAASNEVL